MRTIFFTGKGGVGKSTLAAALCWQLAAAGQRVLGVSIDPAHSLGDVFGAELSDRKTRFAERLYLREVDLEVVAQRYLDRNVQLLQQTYGQTRPLNLDSYLGWLKYAPGVDEQAALTAIEDIVLGETESDVVVFDTPPTGLTLRILALPRLSSVWIERLLAIRRQILDKRHTIHRIAGKGGPKETHLAYDEEADAVTIRLKESAARCARLQSALEGPDNSMALVFNSDRLAMRESLRLVVGLRALGLPLRAAIKNKESLAARPAMELEQELLRELGGVPLVHVPLQSASETPDYMIPVDLSMGLA